MPDQSYQGKLSMFPYDTRFTAIAPPTVGIFDEPQMSICFNVQWAAHIDGVLSRLTWTDAWFGEPETQQWAVNQVTALLVSMIARNPCGGDGCMGECCDDIIERLDRIEALLAAGPVRSPDEIQDDVVGVQEAYETRIDEIEAVYDDDITNVHPEMAYGDANDPIRDQALCFMTRRFVDLFCDWIVHNIQLKVANQQTALNIAAFIGNASGAAARLFAETAFGALFANIDQMLDLEVTALTIWVQTVTESELAVFQDDDAREAVACEWYDGLKGATPTVALFLSSLTDTTLTGNADTIRDKLAAALTPVDVPQQPDGERLYFIWSDLWAEAYSGAQAGIVPECECDDPPSDCDGDDLTVSTQGWAGIDSLTATYHTDEGYGEGSGSSQRIGIIKTFSSFVSSITITFNEPITGVIDVGYGSYSYPPNLGSITHGTPTTEWTLSFSPIISSIYFEFRVGVSDPIPDTLRVICVKVE